MQHKWLRKQLRQLKETSKLVGNVSAVWKDSNGDIVDFLKKMQEPGDGISPATKDPAASEPEASKKIPVHASPPCQGFCGVLVPSKEGASASPAPAGAAPAEEAPLKSEDKSAESSIATKPEAPPAEEAPRKKEEESVESPPSAKPEAASPKEPPTSPAASRDESFLSDADGSGSIAEAIGHT